MVVKERKDGGKVNQMIAGLVPAAVENASINFSGCKRFQSRRKNEFFKFFFQQQNEK